MSSKIKSLEESVAARFEDRALSHVDSLYNRALELTGSEQSAVELVKETFVRALRAFSNNGPENPSRAWMFSIMFSIFAQERPEGSQRSAGNPAMLLDGADGEFDMSDVAELAQIEVAESEWNGRHVAEIVNRLPGELRDAVILVDVDQFPHEDAAQVLRCSVSALRTRLFKARRVLFTELGESARSVEADRRRGAFR
ncbi:MAG TPA: RNA polymerase sigma factor [Opitutaceae bacterium]|nr:RNA polymerase sigma factor [Opitutaceae bacterium]